ncbi:MAG: amidohydrolase [Desulfovibrio sp.]|nr:MAG: amidohydrolase [Desulfovibrio sp.]
MHYDIHTHLFPPQIAAKALRQIEEYYSLRMVGSGLAEDMLERADVAGIDRVVALGAAIGPAQVVPVNNWAIALQRGDERIQAFGSVHPGYAQWEQELDRLRQAGIRGLKFHCEFQGFSMADPGLLEIVRAASPDFVLLFHVGDRLPPEQSMSCPRKLAAILDVVPSARIIAAHLGGRWHWDLALECLAGRELYMDTSSTVDAIDPELFHEILKRHSREKLLFGSDWPLRDPVEDIALLQSRMGLTESEIHELMTNAARLFG